MIAISLPPPKSHWSTLSFASTLYLYPILDILLERVPEDWQYEVRLGLQEALINAAKHGNSIDPGKKISVHFYMSSEQCSWIITDQGEGFDKGSKCCDLDDELLPREEDECGRGLCLLNSIFDQVHWNHKGNQLRISKQFKNTPVMSVTANSLFGS
ncbi:MAG: anti-sigma regulatory factor [Limnothrix sp.]